MNNHCTNCNKEFEEGFDVCWNCGTDKHGNATQEFIRPEDQPEDPDGFTNALNFIGWLTGTFVIRKERQEPMIKGDFILPGWASFLIIALAFAVLYWFCISLRN